MPGTPEEELLKTDIALQRAHAELAELIRKREQVEAKQDPAKRERSYVQLASGVVLVFDERGNIIGEIEVNPRRAGERVPEGRIVRNAEGRIIDVILGEGVTFRKLPDPMQPIPPQILKEAQDGIATILSDEAKQRATNKWKRNWERAVPFTLRVLGAPLAPTVGVETREERILREQREREDELRARIPARGPAPGAPVRVPF